MFNMSKNMADFIFKNPGGALKIEANVGNALAYGRPKATLSSLA